MTSPSELSDEEDDELKDLEEQLSKVKSDMRELYDKVRPINEKLDRKRQQERDYSDKLNRLRDKKQDRKNHRQTIQRLAESESELIRVKSENVKLKQSLDKGTRYSKVQKQKITKLEIRVTALKRELETVDNTAARKLKKQLYQKTEQLYETKEELNKMRQKISVVEERLSVSEQVTAATQQRKLQEYGDSEEMQAKLIPQHQPTADTGSVIVS